MTQNKTQDWKTDFFKALAEKMETFTKDNILMKNENNGEWLMQTVFATSPDKTDFVLIQAAPYQAREDVLLLELYVKLLGTTAEENREELQKAVSELNSYLPVGCLGIYPEDGHLFLRECFRLDMDKSAEQAAADAVVCYELVMEVTMAAYPGLKAIWNGEMTFADAVEKDILKKHSR